MPFQIIFIENDKRPDDSDRGARDARLLATREYETAQEANRAIERHKQWAADYGHTPGKMRIQRMVTAAWEEREAKRLEDGTYTPLPDWWINSWWWQDFNLKPIHRKHFAHMADKHPGKIAFTESPEKGEADIQLVISPTAYLARFFKDHISQRDIRDIGSMFETGEYELHISSRPEDFEMVYENAPNVCGDGSGATSCMRYKRTEFNNGRGLPHHPAYVYGAGDLAIAWIKNDDGEILGRTVIWPEKKTYVRVYGIGANYQALMHTLLKRQGYRHTNEFTGAKLLKIEIPTNHHGYDSYLMTYLDNRCSRYLQDNGDHFVMTTDEDGNVYADCTEGQLRVAKKVTCVKTGITLRASDAYLIDGEFWSYNAISQHERKGNRLYHCDVSSQRTWERTVTIIGQHGYETQVRHSILDSMQTFRCQRTLVLVDANFWQPIQVHTRNGIETWSNHDRSAYRVSRDGNTYARNYYPEREREREAAKAAQLAAQYEVQHANTPPARAERLIVETTPRNNRSSYIRAMQLTPEQIENWRRHNASIYDTWQEAEINPRLMWAEETEI
jgi:hypothetical protein